MNTNAVPLFTTAAQAAGIKLNAEEIGAIVASGGAIVRWMQLEGRAIIAAGGIKVLWAKFVGTSPKP
jgi:hypothetical protein